MGFKKTLLIGASLVALVNAAQAATKKDSRMASLEEIVVTATKQGMQSIQDVSMAISVVNTASLDRQGATSLSDFANSVPSISIQEYGPGQNKFAVRGISDPGNIDPTNLVNQSLVSVYLDDTPISMQGATPDLRVFDLERVEVIRGPQGTLYGASAMAGTIRFISQKPDTNSVFGYGEGNLSLTDGGGTNYNARAMVNLPVKKDKIGLRLSGYAGHESGWIDNVGLGEKDANSVDTTQFRAAARFNLNERLTLDTSVVYAKTEADGNNSAYEDLGDETFTSLTPEKYNDRLWILNGTLNYNFDFATLTSSTSYSSRKLFNQTDNSFFTNYLVYGYDNPPATYNTISNKIHNFVEEVRLSSKEGGPFKWIVGAYYSNSHRQYYQFDPAPGLDDFIGLSSLAFDSPIENNIFYSDQTQDQREIAGFGEVTYTLANRLDLTAGVRYFNYKQEYDLYFSGLAGSFAPGDPIVQRGGSKETGFNPRFVATYHISDDAMVFAEAAKGYRYGGVNQPVPLDFCAAALAEQGLSGPAPVTFGADKLWSYAVGGKSTVANGRATLNANLFYIDWQDMQTNDNLSCGYYFTQNVGHVTSKGIEFEGTAKVTDRIQFSLNASYTDAAAAEAISNLNAPDGQPVPYFPKYIVSASAHYTLPLPNENNLMFEVENQYRSKTYSDFNPAVRRTVPSSNVINAAITYMTDRLEVGLYARNLTNRHVVTAIGTNQNGPLQPGDVYYYSRPRTIGIRLRGNF